MLTAVWRVPERSLAALRDEIARREAIDDPATLRLAPAPAQVSRCNLLLGNGAAQFQVVATSATSGMPPYSALFNLFLTEELFAAVVAVLNGIPQRLAVEYDLALLAPVKASARLIPLSSRLLPWLADYLDSGPIGFRLAVQEAVDEGLAVIEMDLPEQAPEELVSDLYDRVLTRASELLPRLARTWAGDSLTELQVAVVLTVEASQPFHPRLDLASLNLPKNPMNFNPSGAIGTGVAEIEEKQSRLRQFRLSFDPQGAPLAWVRLKWGVEQAVLKPPLFGPVRIAGPAGQPVRLTTGYTDGSPIFKKELMPPDEMAIVLHPQEVGLTQLIIDARPFVNANVRLIKVWLRYYPPHSPTPRQHLIQFEKGEWTVRLWLASPVRTARRYLEACWQIFCADGSIVSPSAAIFISSDSVLTLTGEKTDVKNRQSTDY